MCSASRASAPQSMSTWNGSRPARGKVTRKQSPRPWRYMRTRARYAFGLPGATTGSDPNAAPPGLAPPGRVAPGTALVGAFLRGTAVAPRAVPVFLPAAFFAAVGFLAMGFTPRSADGGQAPAWWRAAKGSLPSPK